MTIFRKLLAAVPLLLLTPGSFAIPTVSCPGVAPNWTCSVTSCGTNTWDVTINRANLGAGETATVLIACNTGDKICNLTVGNAHPGVTINLSITADSGAPQIAGIQNARFERGGTPPIINAGRVNISHMRVAGDVGLIEFSQIDDSVITGKVTSIAAIPSGGSPCEISNLRVDGDIDHGIDMHANGSSTDGRIVSLRVIGRIG